MDVIEAHKHVWEYLFTHKDSLLKKWDWVRFDQNFIQSEGKFSNPPPKMWTRSGPQYRTHITIWQHAFNEWGGNTIYNVRINCETYGITCSIGVEHNGRDEPDYDPMHLGSQTIHENTHANIARHGSPMLNPEIAAKDAVDMVLGWIDMQLRKSNDETTDSK